MSDPMSALELDAEAARRTIVESVRSKLEDAGLSRAVIGLSGGIDSSLTCFLTVEALGRENVLGLLLPYRTSQPDSESDARTVIDALSITSREVDITPMVDPLFDLFPQMSRQRRGNIMSRERMIILYDQSEDFGGLVIGTSNRTEFLLGYFTLYGDAAAAIRPLGNLYKAQVRQLSHAVGVPARIIEKAPSADLWADQTDEGELGFSYNEADQVLFLLTEKGLSEQEIVAAGFDSDVVHLIVGQMCKTAFKREPIPMADVHHCYLSEL